MTSLRIEDGVLAVSIDPRGAELRSVVRRSDGLELLWQGDSRFWPRSSPLLFPIVGKLAGGRYRHEGMEYELPQHGFARDEEFRVEALERDAVRLVLDGKAGRYSGYPFGFGLTVRYALEANRLVARYEVRNPGGEPMLFSIGAHPGFRCPLRDGEEFADHELRFEMAETIGRQMLRDGLRIGESRPLLGGTAVLPLEWGLFETGAVVLAGLRSRSVALTKKGGPTILTLDFTGWPYLGIWTKPGAPFLCLEPWQGVADRVGGAAELSEKEGIVRLEAGTRWARDWSIAVGAEPSAGRPR